MVTLEIIPLTLNRSESSLVRGFAMSKSCPQSEDITVAIGMLQIGNGAHDKFLLTQENSYVARKTSRANAEITFQSSRISPEPCSNVLSSHGASTEFKIFVLIYIEKNHWPNSRRL